MQINELIDTFAEVKSKSDDLKKECDGYSKQIKEVMTEQNLVEYYTEKYKAVVSTIETKSFDDAKLLEKIKSWGEISNKLIRTVEVVDMTALEDAIYNGLVVTSDLAECQVVKKQQRLVVTKIKKEK